MISNVQQLKSALHLFCTSKLFPNIYHSILVKHAWREGMKQMLPCSLGVQHQAKLAVHISRYCEIINQSINRAIAINSTPPSNSFTVIFGRVGGKSYPGFFMLANQIQCYPSGRKVRSTQQESHEIRVHARHILLYI